MHQDLLERYLHAIGQFLPEDSRRDTLAELRANLEDAIEARGSEHGGAATAADVQAVIQAHGRPLTVACRYLPQRYLIGPHLFPIYLIALRRAMPFFLVIYFVSNFAVLAAGSRVDLESLAAILFRFIPALLVFLAVITGIFAVVEYAHGGHAVSADALWETGKLPPVREGRPGRGLTQRVADLVIHCCWGVYLLCIPAHPFWLLGPGIYYLRSAHLAFAPVWHSFYDACLVLLAFQFALKAMALPRRLAAFAPLFKLLGDFGGFLLMAFLAFQSAYLVAMDAETNVSHLARTNQVLHIVIVVLAGIALTQVIVESGRVLQGRGRLRRMVF